MNITCNDMQVLWNYGCFGIHERERVVVAIVYITDELIQAIFRPRNCF